MDKSKVTYLKKGDIKELIVLEKKIVERNSCNASLKMILDELGFFEYFSIRKNVRVLRKGKKPCGVVKINPYGYKECYIDILYAQSAEGYKKLLDGIVKRGYRLSYESDDNEYMSRVLRESGFEPGKQIICMYMKIEGNFKIRSNQRLKLIQFEDGVHEKIRCDVQNKIFAQNYREELRVEDVREEKKLKYYIKDKIFFLMYENEYIGFGQMIKWNGEYQLVNYGIIPKYRGKGFAREFLHILLERLSRDGISEISIKVLQDNYKAYNLYKTTGFNERRRVVEWNKIV